MSLVRPEARAVLHRWGESAVAGGLAAICVAEAVTLIRRGDIVGWFAALAAVLALFWLRSAVARALARRSGDAPGIVEVREREIRYFGPITGGIIELDALARIEVFVPAPGMDPLWRLSGGDGRVLVIPLAAKGAEDLMGAFAALRNFSEMAAVSALRRAEPGRHPVWQRAGSGPGAAITGP